MAPRFTKTNLDHLVGMLLDLQDVRRKASRLHDATLNKEARAAVERATTSLTDASDAIAAAITALDGALTFAAPSGQGDRDGRDQAIDTPSAVQQPGWEVEVRAGAPLIEGDPVEG